MKEFLKKIGAILMAFVVLFSTMSFTVSEHYCGSHLVSIGVFSKATSCGMEKEIPSAINGCNIQNKDCCKDVVKQFKSQQVLKNNFSELNFNQQLFVTAFTYSYLNLFEGLENNIIPFKDYSPPLLVFDIHVLDQVFII